MDCLVTPFLALWEINGSDFLLQVFHDSWGIKLPNLNSYPFLDFWRRWTVWIMQMEPIEVKKSSPVGLDFFENISISKINQRLILDAIAVLSFVRWLSVQIFIYGPTISKNLKNTVLSKWPSYLLQLRKSLEAMICGVRWEGRTELSFIDHNLSFRLLTDRALANHRLYIVVGREALKFISYRIEQSY